LIYLDSSAIIKLILEEAETAALKEWLAARPMEAMISSTLFEVEVPRALHRLPNFHRGRALSVMTRISRREMSGLVRSRAASLPDPNLRSQDAIHLATALDLSAELSAFVGYDKRLLAAAGSAELPVASPGA
jgi:predicted nucleic acid-binding protein